MVVEGCRPARHRSRPQLMQPRVGPVASRGHTGGRRGGAGGGPCAAGGGEQSSWPPGNVRPGRGWASAGSLQQQRRQALPCPPLCDGADLLRRGQKHPGRGASVGARRLPRPGRGRCVARKERARAGPGGGGGDARARGAQHAWLLLLLPARLSARGSGRMERKERASAGGEMGGRGPAPARHVRRTRKMDPGPRRSARGVPEGPHHDHAMINRTLNLNHFWSHTRPSRVITWARGAAWRRPPGRPAAPTPAGAGRGASPATRPPAPRPG
jgi:hypothetical protein